MQAFYERTIQTQSNFANTSAVVTQKAAAVFKGKSPPNTIVDVKATKQKANTEFEWLEEGLYRRNNRIFARVKVDGKCTWRSTKTNQLGQARKWKEKWDRKQWLEANGFLPKATAEAGGNTKEAAATGDSNATSAPAATPASSKLLVGMLLDQYIEAGHPIVKKRALKRKAERTIFGEKHCLNPIRAFFGGKDGGQLSLADCDAYHLWRNSGGYTSNFKVRSKYVTRKARGGDRAVDLELTVRVHERIIRAAHFQQRDHLRSGKDVIGLM